MNKKNNAIHDSERSIWIKIKNLIYPKVKHDIWWHRLITVIGWILSVVFFWLFFIVIPLYFGVFQRIAYFVFYGNDKDKWIDNDSVPDIAISNPDKKCLFYSKEWEKPSSLSIVHNVDYDILITENSFYLLKITKPFIKRVLGIIVILLGAILPGALLVGYFDKKNRNKTRASWVDFNNNLLSDKYAKYIVIQIPLAELKKSLSIDDGGIFKGKSLDISYLGQEMNLKYKKQECARIMEFVDNIKTIYR